LQLQTSMVGALDKHDIHCRLSRKHDALCQEKSQASG
jgi:hypothetical protein